MLKRMKVLLAGLAVLGVALPVTESGAAVPPIENDDPVYGVYLHLVQAESGTFDDVLVRLRRGIDAAGATILAEYAVAVNADDCSYQARTVVVDAPEYAAAVLRNGVTAAFALPLRLAVVEDEAGVHVTAVNPLSINRTIVSETAFNRETREVVALLERFVADEFAGDVRQEEFGQMRSAGLIGKTMGLIAGGPFESKIERITRVRPENGEDLLGVAERLYQGLEAAGGSRRWGIRPAYLYDVSDQGVVMIGVTGEALESRALEIVGNGGDDGRSRFACPGIDHAAAFPIELVLVPDGDQVEVLMIDGMFRMKMYFEDAGKMKFAANMRMPGSIEDEIRDKVEESLY